MRGDWIRKPTGDACVVFVHGILSDGESAWQNSNGTYWPSLLHDEDELVSLGIYSFSYKTSVFSGTYSIDDATRALNEFIILDDIVACSDIIFVCHSMGGIVVRKLLVDPQYISSVEGKNVALFLVASPSLGSSYANWLSPLAKFFGHTQVDALRFCQSNLWLNSLDQSFMSLRDSGRLKLRGREIVEDKFVILRRIFRKQVVEPFAGSRYFGDSVKIPDSDHFSIAKPADNTALQHRLLCRFVIESGLSDSSLRGGSRASTEANNIKPECKVSVESCDGTVWFGEDKYEENGKFSVECNFYLLPSGQDVVLLAVRAQYFAYGCPALSTPKRELSINEQEIKLSFRGDLKKSFKVDADGRARLRMYSQYRPPLKRSAPVDCDDGDIVISLQWRCKGVAQTFKECFTFSYTNAGVREMVCIDKPRLPPRLTDEELREYFAEGKLSKDELQWMLEYNPVSRYMDAFSDNTSLWSRLTPFQVNRLRSMVGNPHLINI